MARRRFLIVGCEPASVDEGIGLTAAVSDAVQPVDRAPAVGVYRFWRDLGFVVGALISGFVADTLGSGAAIAVVAALTALSGVIVAATRWNADRCDER